MRAATTATPRCCSARRSYLAAHGGFDGTLNLIFQPAEEGGGGAPRMIDDGLFERFPCDAVFAHAQHAGHAAGPVSASATGPTMASSDCVTITLHGPRRPRRRCRTMAVDPIVAASSIVMALQTIVSRNVDPLETAVVTVGADACGRRANNVIPETARLELSVRALTREMRALLERRIKALVAAQAESFGVRGRDRLPARLSGAGQQRPRRPRSRARWRSSWSAPERVALHGPAITGSEDFAFMLEQVPGCYLLIGNGDGEGACMVHNPGYDFNDGNLPIGAAYWALLAERFLMP